MCTKAVSELLIRRWLDILKEIIAQEGLVITPRLMRSSENKADVLSRIPVQWTQSASRNHIKWAGAASAVQTMTHADEAQAIRDIMTGTILGLITHGILLEALGEAVTKDAVKRVVRNCTQCAQFCSALTCRWRQGELHASKV